MFSIEVLLGNGGDLELRPEGNDVIVRLERAEALDTARADREHVTSELRDLLRAAFDAMDEKSTKPPVEVRSERVESLARLQSSLRM